MNKVFSIWMLGLLALALAGLLAGSLNDLQLSQALNNPYAGWAKLFAAIGPLPVFWALAQAGFMLDQEYGQAVIWKRILAWLAALAMMALGIVYMSQEIATAYSVNLWVGASIGAVLILFPAFYFSTFFDNSSSQIRKKVILVLVITALGSIAAVQVAKRIWLRPRYMVLGAMPGVEFQNWWVIGNVYGSSMSGEMSFLQDLFYSFPSGHAASAACIFTLMLIPMYGTFKKGKRPSVNMLTIVGAVCLFFTLMTIISRIVLGMHYLSDVSTGVLITIAFLYVSWFFILKKEASA